jgi:hypothetical protein
VGETYRRNFIRHDAASEMPTMMPNSRERQSLDRAEQLSFHRFTDEVRPVMKIWRELGSIEQ